MGGYPKLVTKSGIGEKGVHANSAITTTKIMHNFLILLVFGQRRSSCILVWIPVVVLFEAALAQVLMCRLTKA